MPASTGIYGSFNGILYDHSVPRPVPLAQSKCLTWPAATQNAGQVATLFGPTCDGADVICRDVALPDLAVGDFVAFRNMGAYSWAGACNFNGFEAIWVRFFYVATA